MAAKATDLRVAQLIAVLMFAETRKALLYVIIGQMEREVVWTRRIVRASACAHVAVLVHEHLRHEGYTRGSMRSQEVQARIDESNEGGEVECSRASVHASHG